MANMVFANGREAGTRGHAAWAMDVKAEGKGLAPTPAAGHVVNAAPPVPCGNPACRFHMHPLPATQTTRLPAYVSVDFPNRLVCLECYRKLVGAEPLPAGSSLAAPFIPGGSVLSAAMSGIGQLKGSVGGWAPSTTGDVLGLVVAVDHAPDVGVADRVADLEERIDPLQPGFDVLLGGTGDRVLERPTASDEAHRRVHGANQVV